MRGGFIFILFYLLLLLLSMLYRLCCK